MTMYIYIYREIEEKVSATVPGCSNIMSQLQISTQQVILNGHADS